MSSVRFNARLNALSLTTEYVQNAGGAADGKTIFQTAAEEEANRQELLNAPTGMKSGDRAGQAVRPSGCCLGHLARQD
jgi:hypothetical protein